MSDERYETVDGQRYATWKEVQDKIKNDWLEYLDEIQFDVDVDNRIPNWQYIKESISLDDEYDVEEEFTYNLVDWLNEIYIAVKPIVEDWLNKLLNNTEVDYSDYVNNFWNEDETD